MAESCWAIPREAEPAAGVHAAVAGAHPVASVQEEDADAAARPVVYAGLPPPCPADWDEPSFTAPHVNGCANDDGPSTDVYDTDADVVGGEPVEEPVEERADEAVD